MRENGNKVKDDGKYLIWQKKVAAIQKEEYSSCQYSYLYWGKTGIQKRLLEAKSTKKCTTTAVRRFRCWFEGKQHKQLELHKITKQEDPQMLKHFILKNWDWDK